MSKRPQTSASQRRQKDLTGQAMRRERQLLQRVVQHHRRLRQLARQVRVSLVAADRELRALETELADRFPPIGVDDRLPAAVGE